MSLIPFVSPPDFFSKQLEYTRVASAYASKGKAVDKLLYSKNISTTDYDLFLRALKKSGNWRYGPKTKTKVYSNSLKLTISALSPVL